MLFASWALKAGTPEASSGFNESMLAFLLKN
jgi:hypothetical protein